MPFITGDYMNFAVLNVNEIAYDGLTWAIMDRKLDVEIIDSGVSINSTAPSDADRVLCKLKESRIDIAITMNFCPAISDACMNCGIKYISWIFDNPQQSLFHLQIKNSCNYVFSFDKVQAREIKKLGCPNVFHLPLATNTIKNNGLVITEEDIQKYSSDISFIGSLYEDNLFDLVYEAASDNLKKDMDNIIIENFGKWDGKDRIRYALTSEDVTELNKIGNFDKKIPEQMDYGTFFGARLFSRKLAFIERMNIANLLSQYDFRLYTGSNKDLLSDNVQVYPPLNYSNELPKAYHLSKINLNITLHSIQSGIPLRVFDIMGVGGFMLTNYQPEIEDLFTVGTDLEVYHSIDELEEKALYYLTHENQRLKIAMNGYKTVTEKYSFGNRLDTILDCMNICS